MFHVGYSIANIWVSQMQWLPYHKHEIVRRYTVCSTWKFTFQTENEFSKASFSCLFDLTDIGKLLYTKTSLKHCLEKQTRADVRENCFKFHSVCKIKSLPNPQLKASQSTETKRTFPFQKLKLTWQAVVKDHNKRCITTLEVLKAWKSSIARSLSKSKQVATFIFCQNSSKSRSYTSEPSSTIRSLPSSPFSHATALSNSAMPRRVRESNKTFQIFLSIQRNPSNVMTTTATVNIHIHTCITIFMCVYI